ETRVHGRQYPFVTRRRVHVAAQIVQVEPQHAGGLGAVDKRKDALRPGHRTDLFHRQDAAVGVVDVAEAQQLGLRGYGRLERPQDLVRVLGRVELAVGEVNDPDG